MIKIYADLHKEKDKVYVEDVISSHDLSHLNKNELKNFITDFIKKHGEIHTCYDRFINVIGRNIQSFGERWYGQKFVVYTTEFGAFGKELKKKITHKYDSKGYLTKWTIGYFC